MTLRGWQTVKLQEVVSFKTGKLNSNAAVADGKYPFFTCSQETLRTNTYSFDTECVLLAGNNANGIYPLKYYRGKFDVYQRTYVIRTLDGNRLTNRFLFYVLSPQLDLLKSISTGVTTKFLTLRILNDLEILLPPLPIQRKIAAVLSAYDDLIENNSRRISILEAMAHLLYREWFVEFRYPGHESVPLAESELGLVPEGWEVVRLGDVVELAYGKGLRKNDRQEGPFPVYGSSGVVDYHKEALVTGPGIIVGRKGNVGSVFWADTDFYPIDTTYYVQTELPLHYVYYNLRHQNFMNTHAAVPGLSRENAYRNEFIVPPSGLMTKFQSFIEPVFTQVRKLNTKNDNLRQTRDLLLPRLISGDLDVAALDIVDENVIARP